MTVIREADRYLPGRSGAFAWLCGIARNHSLETAARGQRLVALAGEEQAE